MGYILPEYYNFISNNKNREMPRILIETGTFKGGLAHRFLETFKSIRPFEKIYTFELGENICKIASKRFKQYDTFGGDLSKFNFHTDELDENFKNEGSYHNESIHLINSDSVIGLKKLLQQIDEPCCFWLDAHVGAAKYARGPKDVPLLDELEVISTHHIKNHIIAIDDSHLFGQLQYNSKTGDQICDYREITYDTVCDSLLRINETYTVETMSPYGHNMLVAY
jgi:hypothetical protein